MKQKYKVPKKTRVYSLRFDYDMLDFIEKQPNLSKFINTLIRKEMDRLVKLETNEELKPIEE